MLLEKLFIAREVCFEFCEVCSPPLEKTFPKKKLF
jgi:hypothetical protein